MRIAYFDCIGGASGDMLLASLVDAGASEEAIQSAINALHLAGCSLSFERTQRGALSALKASTHIQDTETARQLPDLITIVNAAKLPAVIKKRATRILERIAQVEANIHEQSLAEVYLHELGGDDILIDIIGVLTALKDLKIEQCYISSLPLGRGWIQSAHGKLPLPTPATLELLQGANVHYVESEWELVTPTGAALLTAIATEYGGFPPMRLIRIGTGGGQRELPFPNVVRVWLGDTQGFETGLISETLTVLETSIDDMNPQLYEIVAEHLFSAGALDVTLTPLQMKKNRPGTLLSVLCENEIANILLGVLLRETTTLGVRRYPVERLSMPRRIVTVDTLFGPIRIKIADWNGVNKISPEYEDCKKAAQKHGVPLADVILQARTTFEKSNL